MNDVGMTADLSLKFDLAGMDMKSQSQHYLKRKAKRRLTKF